MGQQHYKHTQYFHKTEEDFLKQKERDKIKKELAIKNGFNYLEIPYNYQNDLKTILINLIGSTTISNESRGKCLEVRDFLDN